MPKLPDANEAILGAWHAQPQVPRFPIRGSAYLATLANEVRSWSIIPESMAWYAPWTQPQLIVARRQTVEAVGPGNFLTSGEAPYLWLWSDVAQRPVIYQPGPQRSFTTEIVIGALALPAGSIVVSGPYLIKAGQLYVAGAVQGDLSSE